MRTDIPAVWLRRHVAARYERALKALDAVPMDQRTWEAWQSVKLELVAGKAECLELERMAAWVKGAKHET